MRGFALAMCLGTSLAAMGPVSASERESTGQAGPITFDIPAQPLPSALDAYSAMTGLEVLYDSGLADRHRSSSVKGAYTIRDALSLLLAGSGLEARPISVGAITIVALPAARRVTPPGPRPAESPYRAYFAAIQESFEQTLCRSAGVIPQDYRAVVKFEVGPSGQIEHPQLLQPTGNPSRDRVVADLLGHMTVGQAPPAGLPQPVMLLVLPQSSGDQPNCSPQ
jgi:hypothetical protein